MVALSQEDCEAAFIQAHRGHLVETMVRNWLYCRTCGVPLMFVTQQAFAALRKIRK